MKHPKKTEFTHTYNSEGLRKEPAIRPSDLLKPKHMFMANDSKVERKTLHPIQLLIRTIGGHRQIFGKIWRLLNAIYLSLNFVEYHRRLKRLKRLGLMAEIPSRLQLWVGGIDMLRYFINPGAVDYYKSRGIGYGFHQLLRFLDDPASLIDPIGIRSPKDTIIGHLMQVVHANPIYDFQLLEMYDDGLFELEKQILQMIEGTHIRQKSIGAIVEDREYHARLLAYLQEYKVNPLAQPPLRRAGHARENPDFRLAECMFGSMPGFFRYANRLPKTVPALIRHLKTEKVLNPKYVDQEILNTIVNPSNADKYESA